MAEELHQLKLQRKQLRDQLDRVLDKKMAEDLDLQVLLDKRKATIAFKTMALKKASDDFKLSTQDDRKLWALDLQLNYGAIAQFVTEFKSKQHHKELLYARLNCLLNLARETAEKTTGLCVPLIEAASLKVAEQAERVKEFDLDAHVTLPMKEVVIPQKLDSVPEEEEARSPHITILSANDSPVSCSPKSAFNASDSPSSSPKSSSEYLNCESSLHESFSSAYVSIEPSSLFESVHESLSETYRAGGGFPVNSSGSQLPVSSSVSDSFLSANSQLESFEETKQPAKVPPINWVRPADVDTSLSSLMEKSAHTVMTDSVEGPVEWSKYWDREQQYEVEVKRKSTWKRLICPCFS